MDVLVAAIQGYQRILYPKGESVAEPSVQVASGRSVVVEI